MEPCLAVVLELKQSDRSAAKVGQEGKCVDADCKIDVDRRPSGPVLHPVLASGLRWLNPLRQMRVAGKLAKLPLLWRGTPVFIVGSGRCGSTLLLSILSADPSLYCIQKETEVFRRIKRPTRGALLRAKGRLYEAILQEERPIERQVRYVEKTPLHVRAIEHIRKAYHNKVCFIHIVRDGRDVITSRHPTSHPGGFHIEKERWVGDVLETERHEGDPLTLVIRYEDLVRHFDDTLRRIYGFLGQTIPEQVLHYTDHAEVKTHIAWTGRVRPLDASSIGRWKNPDYKPWIKELTDMPEAERLLRKFGYIE